MKQNTIQDITKQIQTQKQERDVFILAHSYQSKEITEIADFVGDSFQLSVKAQQAKQKTVVMCGVHFMAETVKMLSPDKKVILANGAAGCPMAEQLDPELLQAVKRKYPDAAVVCYINTTAALKEHCDVCVTSSTAVKIVKAMQQDKIIFVPDCNLGDYVQKQVPEKEIILVQGGCPIHASVSEQETIAVKQAHPDALLLVHPECTPKVVQHADFVGSTSQIVDFAVQSKQKEFIIGTELSIAETLQYACPDKNFFMLSKKLICPNMKITTLVDVLHAVQGIGGREIDMTQQQIAASRRCIDQMLALGK